MRKSHTPMTNITASRGNGHSVSAPSHPLPHCQIYFRSHCAGVAPTIPCVRATTYLDGQGSRGQVCAYACGHPFDTLARTRSNKIAKLASLAPVSPALFYHLPASIKRSSAPPQPSAFDQIAEPLQPLARSITTPTATMFGNCLETILHTASSFKASHRIASILKPLNPAKLFKKHARHSRKISIESKQNIDIPSRNDDDGCRVDWRNIRDIVDDDLRCLVLQYCAPDGKTPLKCTKVLWRSQGSYHFVACVGLFRNRQLEQYTIRVPGHANLSSWTEQDAWNLAREVDTMRLVQSHTKVPVPQVFGYSTNHTNPIGFPFILMEFIQGDSAFQLWFEDTPEEAVAYKYADEPSDEVEQKRVNFLRSLAQCMASLEQLSFDKIGQPLLHGTCDTGLHTVHTAGHSYHFGSSSDTHKAIERPTFSTTRDMIAFGMNQCFSDCAKSCVNVGLMGTRKILEIVFAQPFFQAASSPETFTLHHNDLDLQNILVNKDGEITGIIDWDGTYAAPRCIGAAAVPKFLRKDWFPDFANGIDKAPYMVWKTEHYRQIYAAAYTVVIGDGSDAKFAAKSAIYQAAFAAILDDGDVADFTDKILRKVPGISMNTTDIKWGLGNGWPAFEQMLGREIAAIMAPEPPQARYLDTAFAIYHGLDDDEEIVQIPTEDSTDSDSE